MFSYIAYGLGIRSEILLPELVAGEAAPDVVIRLGKVEPLPSEVSAEEAHIIRDELGMFLVRCGREIVIEPVPGADERVLRLVILGPGLALLLHQRGLLTLHGSAVGMNGGAIAFLGWSGGGKSTMAAALHARGHSIVADDVTAVQLDSDSPIVFPGFPQLKLWPEAALSLGDDVATLPRLQARTEKRARRVTRAFPQTPLPLRCIYVLAEGEAEEIEPLPPQEALVELVRHSYWVQVRRVHSAAAPSHFLQCANLAQKVPVHRLKRPRFLPGLPDLARMVEEDLARVAGHKNFGPEHAL